MKKRVWIILSLILLIPLCFYIVNFSSYKISDSTEIWAQFGDYLNGTFMPIIALIGVVITYYLGILSDRRIAAQTESTKLINDNNMLLEKIKHKPMLYIGYWDGKENIELTICNKGIGPLLITSYKLENVSKNKIFSSVYEAVADIENDYDDFSGNHEGLVLAPNEQRLLLSFKLNEKKDKNAFEKDRLKIRKSLKDLKFIIKYQDVYKEDLPEYTRELSWFGR